MPDLDVAEVADLSARQVYDVLELRNVVAAASGTSPLSDHVVSAVKGHAPGMHFLQTAGADVVGYAHLDDEADHVAELLVGDGGDIAGLLRAVSASAGPSLRIWTRGDHAPLNDVLPNLGFTARRTLLQLRRPLDVPALPEPSWPDGVTVREFRVGIDEEAWLAVNNAAFSGHPEQADWTADDIHAREDEPWFDPAGFFLAEVEGRIVGFHWTKVHVKPGGDLGEVYVIGVAPAMQGKRLGESLLLRGLRHLHDLGLSAVLLYVEADNTGAIALYERHGFTRWDADQLFTRTQ
ncbi:MAG TPA: mycothiol synthase [Mycobacteriales bacterium]|nr:mycothiol synthase [Mycobacteriales bacterium]